MTFSQKQAQKQGVKYCMTEWNRPFSVVADILCEFLEVAIHLILYVREVYPSGIFQKRKKYSVPVQVETNIYVNIIIMLKVYRKSHLFISLLMVLCLWHVYKDVMSPGAESVYPRYAAMCKATH